CQPILRQPINPVLRVLAPLRISVALKDRVVRGLAPPIQVLVLRAHSHESGVSGRQEKTCRGGSRRVWERMALKPTRPKAACTGSIRVPNARANPRGA